MENSQYKCRVVLLICLALTSLLVEKSECTSPTPPRGVHGTLKIIGRVNPGDTIEVIARFWLPLNDPIERSRDSMNNLRDRAIKRRDFKSPHVAAWDSLTRFESNLLDSAFIHGDVPDELLTSNSWSGHLRMRDTVEIRATIRIGNGERQLGGIQAILLSRCYLPGTYGLRSHCDCGDALLPEIVNGQVVTTPR